MKIGENTSKIEAIRHSLAHLLAASVLKKFPDAKLGVGPVIENGFYYDIQFPQPIGEDILPELEKSMRELIAAELDFVGERVTPARARPLFKDQPFKLDLIKDFAKEKEDLTIYYTGKKEDIVAALSKKSTSYKLQATSYFVDLCRGGHVKNTREINPDAFRLAKIAGAYWKGDEANPQLTRIYGYAFQTAEELKNHLEMLEEAGKRDHKTLGRELGLFVFSNLVGPGLPLYTPRGASVLAEIKNFSRRLRREIGYEEVETPQINKGELFKTSGHYEKYLPDMFAVRSHYSKEEYFLKPMNCPQHTQIYASEPRSYRDLPIRFADFALLYRDEKPGELSGLARLRSFSQDDGHAFLREDQIEEEFRLILGAIKKAMAAYGLSYYIRLSLRDENNKSAYLGADALWHKAESAMKKFLKASSIEFIEAKGEAAFYGPKADLMAKDALGREWQLSTIQLDLNMPERFKLEYIGEDGKKHRPVMMHSALVGSPERLLGMLIEHYKGAFPFWLAPVQVKILTISDKVVAYGGKIKKDLLEKSIRAELDGRNESLNKKIRDAELEKVPHILVVGEKEAEAKRVSVRERGKGDLGQRTLEEFVALAEK